MVKEFDSKFKNTGGVGRRGLESVDNEWQIGSSAVSDVRIVVGRPILYTRKRDPCLHRIK